MKATFDYMGTSFTVEADTVDEISDLIQVCQVEVNEEGRPTVDKSAAELRTELLALKLAREKGELVTTEKFEKVLEEWRGLVEQVGRMQQWMTWRDPSGYGAGGLPPNGKPTGNVS